MGVTHKVDWTPENVNLLRQMASEGYSFSQVAALIPNATRCSVGGKAMRMGVSFYKAPKPKPRVKKTYTRPTTPRHSKLSRYVKQPRNAPQAVPKPLPNEPTPLMESLMDLEPNQCHWPYGDPKTDEFGYCGHMVSSTSKTKSYCEFHDRKRMAG